MSTLRIGTLAVVVLAVAACSSGTNGGGTSGGTSGGAGGVTLTIANNFTFPSAPTMVAAGSTITVVNSDSATHSVTSEAAAKDYTKGTATNGFAFDTGLIAAGASATITVPATIPSGTSMPYFCTHHLSSMINPDPVITIK